MTTVEEQATDVVEPAAPSPSAPKKKSGGRTRKFFMRPRKAGVKVHRWLSLGLMVWIVIVAITGAWLVESHQFEAWMNRVASTRRRVTSGRSRPSPGPRRRCRRRPRPTASRCRTTAGACTRSTSRPRAPGAGGDDDILYQTVVRRPGLR